MKLFIKVSVLLYIASLSIFQVAALDSKTSQVYARFEKDIQDRYSPEKVSNILESVQKRLLDLSYTKLSSQKLSRVQDTIALNNEAIYKIWIQEELSQSSQKFLEAKIRDNLATILASQSSPADINELLSDDRTYIPTNEKGEFVQDDSIYKVQYTNYFPINAQSSNNLKRKKGIIIQVSSDDYRFIEDFRYEKKFPYSELADTFAGYFTPNFQVIEKDGFYFGYIFDKFRFYEDTYGAYQQDMLSSGFDVKDTFLYRDSQGKYNFVTEYTERKLLSISDMFGLSQKQSFLEYMLSDARYLTSDITQNMKAVRELSMSIPKGKNSQETIENIYAWILENISYTQIIDFNNLQMFSGGESLQTKNGVCSAYVKLMSYLLLYSGIYDIEMIGGHVIDAPDFPKIGHAWLRINDKYYDPTFDDPIGNTQEKSSQEYLYFGLPKDIFYANRFTIAELPESFTTASSEQISQYIFNTLSNLKNIYGSSVSNYPVFAPVLFRNQYNISATTLITPTLLAQKIGSYGVDGKSFTYEKEGRTIQILGIKYYPLTAENTQGVLSNLKYNTKNTTLFDWVLPDGTREWRLAYELTER